MIETWSWMIQCLPVLPENYDLAVCIFLEGVGRWVLQNNINISNELFLSDTVLLEYHHRRNYKGRTTSIRLHSFLLPWPVFTLKVSVTDIFTLQSVLLMHDLESGRMHSLINLWNNFSHAFSRADYDLRRRRSDPGKPFDHLRNCAGDKSVSRSTSHEIDFTHIFSDSLRYGMADRPVCSQTHPLDPPAAAMAFRNRNG